MDCCLKLTSKLWLNIVLSIQSLVGISLLVYSIYLNVYYSKLPAQLLLNKYTSYTISAGVLCIIASVVSCCIRCGVACSDSIVGKLIIFIYTGILVVVFLLLLVAGVSLYNWVLAVSSVVLATAGAPSIPYSQAMSLIHAVITSLRLDAAVQAIAPNIYNFDASAGLQSAYNTCCTAGAKTTATIENCFWVPYSAKDCSSLVTFDKTAVPALLEFVSPFVIFIWCFLLVVALSIIFCFVLMCCDCQCGSGEGRYTDTKPVTPAYRPNTVQHYAPSAPAYTQQPYQHTRHVSNINDGTNLSVPMKYGSGVSMA